MKKSILPIILFLLCWQFLSAQKSSVFPFSDDWQLIWHDEFSGNELDRGKWSTGWEWNIKTSNYPLNTTEINGKPLIEVSNGTLKQYARNIASDNRPHTSSLVKTRRSGNDPPLFIFHHGYVEVKVRRQAAGNGFHFNVFTFGYDKNENNGGQSFPPEIDITESISNYNPMRLLQVTHFGPSPDAQEINKYQNHNFDWSQWHVYGAHWKADNTVSFYIDGKKTYTTTDKLTPDMPHFIHMRIGVGGWGEPPDENTVFPAIQEVDWIRVYQKPQSNP